MSAKKTIFPFAFHSFIRNFAKNCENRLRLSNSSELDCIRLALSLQSKGIMMKRLTSLLLIAGLCTVANAQQTPDFRVVINTGQPLPAVVFKVTFK